MTAPAPSSAPPPAPRRPPWTARLVAQPLFWAAAVGLLFGLPIVRSMMRRLDAAPAILGTLPPFALTDQRGQPFGTRELRGKVWVADFMFTSCQAACPLLSQRMAEVGRRARGLGPDFHLVSISVDPERDTPERLSTYAARYGAHPLAWSFLTGRADEIEAAVVDGFKVGMGKERENDSAPSHADTKSEIFQIFHGENLVLIDRELRIRGYFPATPEGLDLLMVAVGRVANGA